MEDSLAEVRLYSGLLSGFAAVALILSVTGIYGLMVFIVGRRTRELAIRRALGSSTLKLFATVLKTDRSNYWTWDGRRCDRGSGVDSLSATSALRCGRDRCRQLTCRRSTLGRHGACRGLDSCFQGGQSRADDRAQERVIRSALIGDRNETDTNATSRHRTGATRPRFMAIQVSVSGHLVPETDTWSSGPELPYSYKSLNYIHLNFTPTLAR